MIQKVIKYKYEGNTYDSFAQLKQAYPYISFPVGADADVLSTLGIEKVEEYPPLERCKEILKAQAGLVFAKKRDAIRWVEIDGIQYGFDCAAVDITNFMAAYTPLLIAGTGTTYYKVWLSASQKGLAELTLDGMTAVYNATREGQLAAYAWYEAKKAEIDKAKSIKTLLKITLEEQ